MVRTHCGAGQITWILFVETNMGKANQNIKEIELDEYDRKSHTIKRRDNFLRNLRKPFGERAHSRCLRINETFRKKYVM